MGATFILNVFLISR